MPIGLPKQEMRCAQHLQLIRLIRSDFSLQLRSTHPVRGVCSDFPTWILKNLLKWMNPSCKNVVRAWIFWCNSLCKKCQPFARIHESNIGQCIQLMWCWSLVKLLLGFRTISRFIFMCENCTHHYKYIVHIFFMISVALIWDMDT